MSITEIVENLEDQVNNIEGMTSIPSDERDEIIYRLNGIIDDLEDLDNEGYGFDEDDDGETESDYDENED